MTLSLFAADLSIQEVTTPGKYPFLGIVTFGGVPSDGYVIGSEVLDGEPKKTLIDNGTLAAKISGLRGKPIFAAEGLEDHEDSSRVGEFVDAWVEFDESGRATAKASGFLDAAVNPELVSRMVSLARANRLGLSYDFSNFSGGVETVGGEEVLRVRDMVWAGATAVKRERAAYQQTQLAASKGGSTKESTMDKNKGAGLDPGQLKEALGEILPDILSAAIQDSPITKRLDSLDERVNSLQAAKEEKQPQQKAKVEEPAKKTEEPTYDDEVSLEQLSATIAAGVTEGLKPVLEGLKAALTPPKEEPTNERQSVGSEKLTLLASKYGLEQEDEELQIGQVEHLIAQVSGDTKISHGERDATLRVLGAAKRRIIHAARAAAV